MTLHRITTSCGIFGSRSTRRLSSTISTPVVPDLPPFTEVQHSPFSYTPPIDSLAPFDPPFLAGYTSTFGRLTEEPHDGLREFISPLAFNSMLADSSHAVVAIIEHDHDYQLASTRDGTLQLRATEHGLAVAFAPLAHDQHLGVHVLHLMHSHRRLWRGMSQRRHVQQWRLRTTATGETVREILAATIDEVTLTSTPVYGSTTAAIVGAHRLQFGPPPALSDALTHELLSTLTTF